ncbi:Transcription factor BTF3 4 [Bonamia ostreae]|uniref:Nascent polypeptide-associated complex subunit beta n=1 Tax=Bonamia ostreae TaxID=126728 RepID=A0ABV2AJ54_9EUKA
MTVDPKVMEERIAKRFGNKAVQTRGRGAVRQNAKKRVNKKVEEQKLNALLEKNHLNNKIEDIPSVTFIKDDDTVVTFEKPVVKATIQSKIFAITGKQINSTIEEMMPGIHKKLDAETRKRFPLKEEDIKSIGEFPDLVEDFEAISNQKDENDKKSSDQIEKNDEKVKIEQIDEKAKNNEKKDEKDENNEKKEEKAKNNEKKDEKVKNNEKKDEKAKNNDEELSVSEYDSEESSQYSYSDEEESE